MNKPAPLTYGDAIRLVLRTGPKSAREIASFFAAADTPDAIVAVSVLVAHGAVVRGDDARYSLAEEN
jgi:hypothetical protein